MRLCLLKNDTQVSVNHVFPTLYLCILCLRCTCCWSIKPDRPAILTNGLFSNSTKNFQRSIDKRHDIKRKSLDLTGPGSYLSTQFSYWNVGANWLITAPINIKVTIQYPTLMAMYLNPFPSKRAFVPSTGSTNNSPAAKP